MKICIRSEIKAPGKVHHIGRVVLFPDSLQTFHIGSVKIGERRVVNRIIRIDDLLGSADVLTILDGCLEDHIRSFLDGGVVIIVKCG